MIERLARGCSAVISYQSLLDEWKVYQAGIVSQSDENSVVNVRIDHYWRQIISARTAAGCQKYHVLSQMIKCLLVVPLGNVDVPREV